MLARSLSTLAIIILTAVCYTPFFATSARADDSLGVLTQTVRGVVFDAISNAPVAGATVAIIVNGKVQKGSMQLRPTMSSPL